MDGHRGERAAGRPRWRRSSSTCRTAGRTAAASCSTRCSTSTPSSTVHSTMETHDDRARPDTRGDGCSPRCARSASRCRRGRSATRAPGSRCSPSRACRATRTRRSPTPRRCTGSPASRRAWRCTSRGTGSTTTPTWPSTPPTRASRSARSTPTSSRTTTTCSAASPTPTPAVRRKATDHLLECVDIMDAHRVARPQAVVLRRHQLPGPGRHPRPPGPAGRGAGRGLRPARRRPADAAGVQAVRAGLLHDGRARLGHRLRPLHRARAEGAGRHRHRPPRARARTSSSSSPCCCGRASSAAFDFNSRFYADDDLMVGAADPFQLFRIMCEIVAAAALDPATGIAFMLDQCHNIEPKIPARDPLGDERPGGHGQGAARRRRRAGRRAARPATCSAPTPC